MWCSPCQFAGAHEPCTTGWVWTDVLWRDQPVMQSGMTQTKWSPGCPGWFIYISASFLGETEDVNGMVTRLQLLWSGHKRTPPLWNFHQQQRRGTGSMDQSPGQTDLIDAEGKQEPAQDHRNTQGYERHRRLRLLQSERTIHRLIPRLIRRRRG